MADGAQPSVQYAAGIMYEDQDGRVLLLRRAAPDGRWAFPGGGIESDDDSAESAARRESREEIGYEPDGKLTEWTHRIADDAGSGVRTDFRTYHRKTTPEENFTPTLNSEHDAYQWIDRRAALDSLNLHPGVRIALLRPDMDELAVAKAIRDGELAGPIQYVNVALVAIRITGTGAAYRVDAEDDDKGEFVWRDPSLYLNDTFVQRCNGLPVILDHPTDKDGKPAEFLSPEEFSKRIVGTVFLPYISGDEVWAIAKIYDIATADFLCVKQISTSPCVVFRRADVGSRYELDDGTRLLIEGKPLLLDHVALCANGVWDKGGPPTGVAVDNTDETESRADSLKEAKMDEPMIPAADAGGVANTPGGDKLDMILKGMGDLSAKHDAMCARLDAFEKKPGGDGEGTGTIPPKVEPAVGTTRADAQNGETGQVPAIETDKEALAKEREENHLAINDAVTKATKPLIDQIAAMNARIPIEMPADERAKFARFQMAAEPVYQAFGDSAGAPSQLNGEKLRDYRVRLLKPLQKHSASWAKVDLTVMHDDALAVAEKVIISDSMAVASHPTTGLEGGRLRMRTTVDASGRRINSFSGPPRAFIEPFCLVPRRVTDIIRKPN